jgi:trigger factor
MSLQIVEKSGEGLSRVIGVTVPWPTSTPNSTPRSPRWRPTLRLKGFRPGKVPSATCARSMARRSWPTSSRTRSTNPVQQALTEAKLRAASAPDLKMTSDPDRVVAGQEDLAFDIEVEVMPDFTPVDVSTLELTRPVHEASDEEVETELQSLAEQSRTYEPRKGKTAKAADGDQLLIDFTGRLDGEVFEGGSGQDMELVLGAGRFIPGFEEQLVGAKAGETRTLSVTFPEQYQAQNLAGKPAEFEVVVKEVRAPVAAAVDETLATRLGLENLDALRDAVRRNLSEQYGAASRFKLKRALLDQLDKTHDFPLPPRMVEAEFEVIWNQVHADLHAGRLSPEDQGKSHDELRAEYRKIAERRVRLGWCWPRSAGRTTSRSRRRAEQRHPGRSPQLSGQERQVFDFYRQNPQAAAQLRAPVYEEKVVELIFNKAKITDQPVSKEELAAEDDLPEGYAAA